MKQLTFIVAIVLLNLSWACNQKVSEATAETTAEEAVEQLQDEKDIAIKGGSGNAAFVVASIKKTPCFGRCPVYEATLYSDNRVVYEGKQYTDRKGTFQAKISNSQLEDLIKAALAADYFALAENYPINGQRIADLPSTITFLKIGDKENKVNNNHDAPQALRAYEQAFVRLLDSLQWKAVEEKQ